MQKVLDGGIISPDHLNPWSGNLKTLYVSGNHGCNASCVPKFD